MAKANKKPVAKDNVPAAAVEAAAAPAAPLEPVQLTVTDLQLLGRIVDLASRRGAFQASELAQVGEAFNKLSGFLAYVESTQAPAAEAEGEEVAAEAEAA